MIELITYLVIGAIVLSFLAVKLNKYKKLSNIGLDKSKMTLGDWGWLIAAWLLWPIASFIMIDEINKYAN